MIISLMKSHQVKKFSLLILFTLVALIIRFLPHPPNFSALGALAIFAGYLFPLSGIGFLFPLAALLLSDAVLGFYSGFGFVYLGFALVFFIGSLFKKTKCSAFWMPAGALSGSILFYLITNFGHWLSTKMYPLTLDGLFMSYLAGLPFLRWSLLGEFLFGFAFLAAYLVTMERSSTPQDCRIRS